MTTDLPEPEFPTDGALKAPGGLVIPCPRATARANWPVKALPPMLRPPVDSGQFRVFSHDSSRRAARTGAHPGSQAGWTAGEILGPARWRTGADIWPMTVIAHHGPNTIGQVLRAFLRGRPERITHFQFVRVDGGGRQRNGVRPCPAGGRGTAYRRDHAWLGVACVNDAVAAGLDRSLADPRVAA